MNKRKLLRARFIALFCVLSAIVLFAVPKVGAQTGKATIEELVNIFASLQSNSLTANNSKFSQAANYIDYPTMAEKALGESNWNKLSSQQRKIYLQSFRTLIENRYYMRWHRIFAKSKITYENEEKRNGSVIVKTKIITGKDTKMAAWTLTGQEPKVINLTVDDHDLLARAQTRFQRKISGVGVPAFIAWIKNKAKNPSEED